ncbi:MAG: DUF2783 domain-containing protein [Anderseniella sp.]|jgi:hypothetical protein|nr:DUF2783 domain-containing protein [Anderseniella sp.]
MNDKGSEKDGLGADGDAFYEALMAAHEGLDEAQGHALNARLVLLMANEIGDMTALAAILRTARKFND